jgi:hypothetical protein
MKELLVVRPKILRDLLFDVLYTSGNFITNVGDLIRDLAWKVDPPTETFYPGDPQYEGCTEACSEMHRYEPGCEMYVKPDTNARHCQSPDCSCPTAGDLQACKVNLKIQSVRSKGSSVGGVGGTGGTTYVRASSDERPVVIDDKQSVGATGAVGSINPEGTPGGYTVASITIDERYPTPKAAGTGQP